MDGDRDGRSRAARSLPRARRPHRHQDRRDQDHRRHRGDQRDSASRSWNASAATLTRRRSGARVGRVARGTLTQGDGQCGQHRRGLGVVALAGTLECRTSPIEVSPSRQDQAEARGCRGVLLLIGQPIRRFCGHEVSALLQQSAQVKAAVGIAPLLGPPVTRLCAGKIPALLQQDAEVECGGGVAVGVGVPIRPLGSGRITPSFQ
jgi:hypothetical protein